MPGALSLIDLFGGPPDAIYDPEETLETTASGMDCEARVRRALSRLAAAQAAHCESPGSDEHRNRLVTAAFHAEIAQDLAHTASVARDREARQDRIHAARHEFARGFNASAVAAE
ncbi:MAG: hypothetical protein AAF684_11730 [Pseudomonadota bacterium]